MSIKSTQPVPANTSGSEELSDNDLQAVAGGMSHIGPMPIPIGPPIAIDPIDIVPLPITPLPYDTK